MNCLSSSEGEGQSSAICYNTDYRMFERQWEQRTTDADSSTTSDGEINPSFVIVNSTLLVLSELCMYTVFSEIKFFSI